jgi:hypothetical protein
LGQAQGGRRSLTADLEPVFAVLNPGGRDRTRLFAQGAGLPSDPGHPPVNYHAYAACCQGGFYRKSDEVPDTVRYVLVLLRKDGLGHALNAVRRLRRRGKRVLVSWKESGLTQAARILAKPGLYQRFRAICREVDGFISSTMELVPLYEAARCGCGGFAPTPYPIEESAWDFSLPISQRRGIFIGTREFGVPSRNHLLAISSVLKLGQSVTVINTEGWTGARLLRSISRDLRFISGKLPYTAYLSLMAQHRIVFQLDRSAVPGQVAGDALLCGLPCIGGDGAVDKLAFPGLCGTSLPIESAVKVAERLLADDNYYAETLEKSRELALKRLSFSKVKGQLLSEFAI